MQFAFAANERELGYYHYTIALRFAELLKTKKFSMLESFKKTLQPAKQKANFGRCGGKLGKISCKTFPTKTCFT